MAEARSNGSVAQQASMSLDILNSGLVAALEAVANELLLSEDVESSHTMAEVPMGGGSPKL
eukprot:COSAG02_NODE_5522_length_4260_cov_2.569815_8_plen_61_part_00